MSELRAIDVPALVARAEEALSKASGGVVKLGALHPLGDPDRRNFIARAIAHSDGANIRSVVVKATRSPTYDPAAESLLQISGLAREWVATAYLAACAPAREHGCALLVGDVPSGLLVFEDLGADVSSLVDPLLNGTADGAETRSRSMRRRLLVFTAIRSAASTPIARCFSLSSGRAGRSADADGALRAMPMLSRN
jgi:hypothetical protein